MIYGAFDIHDNEIEIELRGDGLMVSLYGTDYNSSHIILDRSQVELLSNVLKCWLEE